MPAITITSIPGSVHLVVQPQEFLGPDAFQRYLDACRRAAGSFSAARKAHLCPRGNLAVLVTSLRAGGFDPILDVDLAAGIRAEQAARDAVAAAAEERLNRAEGLRLFPFQVAGVKWLAPRDRAILADEMGLGKTIQALMAAPADAPVVVVCPAAVKGVWQREAARWRPDLRVAVLSGRGAFRWPGAGQMFVLNYDILPPVEPKPEAGLPGVPLPAAAPGTVVIADEAHALKTPKAQRTKRFRAVAKAARAAGGKTWLLTGTPILNRPPELWSVASAADLEREAWGNWKRFCWQFRRTKSGWSESWGEPMDEARAGFRRIALQRKRAEVMPELPAKTTRHLSVEIGAADRAVLDDCAALLAEAGIDLGAEMTEAQRSRFAGICFETLSRARAALAAAKMPALMDVVAEYEEVEEPVVVFSAHRVAAEAFAGRPGWAKITGDESPEARTATVAAFQGGQLKGIALTIAAGGVGLTLTRAAHVVFLDLAWTPALNAQAEDRVCRIGQTRPVVVTRLVASHQIDARVHELLGAKETLIAAVEAAPEAQPDAQDVLLALANASNNGSAAGVAASGQRAADDSLVPAPASSSVSHLPPALPQSTPAPVVPSQPMPADNRPRMAQDPVEQWAAAALLTLAGLDRDHARIVNGVGFNKMDGEFGHSLAAQLDRRGTLTPRQWGATVKLCRKYHRQVGSPPSMPATETASS